MLYDIYSSSLPANRKRQFFQQAEDWQALRDFDNGSFDETDLSTGGIDG